jgi:hypothetical protein
VPANPFWLYQIAPDCDGGQETVFGGDALRIGGFLKKSIYIRKSQDFPLVDLPPFW